MLPIRIYNVQTSIYRLEINMIQFLASLNEITQVSKKFPQIFEFRIGKKITIEIVARACEIKNITRSPTASLVSLFEFQVPNEIFSFHCLSK